METKACCVGAQGNDVAGRSTPGGDAEAGPPPPPQPAAEERDRHMDEFFREVSAIKVLSLLYVHSMT